MSANGLSLGLEVRTGHPSECAGTPACTGKRAKGRKSDGITRRSKKSRERQTPRLPWVNRRGVTYRVVDNIGEGPGGGRGQDRDAEEDQMQEQDAQGVRQPNTFTVQPGTVRVDVSVASDDHCGDPQWS